MKLLLLQDHLYLPSFGGGIKANRLLLESLVRRGHECNVASPAFTTRAGPGNESEFLEQMKQRGVPVAFPEPGLYSYSYNGVNVDAMAFPSADRIHELIARRIHQIQPDAVLANDDKRRLFLSSAVAAAPDRVILLLQTVVNLPFGPLAAQESGDQLELMRRARRIVVISHFLQDYLYRYAQLESTLISFPVYGDGPFPVLGQFDRGFVTLINPCVEKGLGIFLALARDFPSVPFAAVPTWGADQAVLEALLALPNMTILEPAEDVDEIYKRTRVLLAPSVWTETFGYVVPEAMLRGIPVLAGNIGGLPEAKLGVDYLLPVIPAERHNGTYTSPPQNIAPWANALRQLLTDPDAYRKCSVRSRQAALKFHSGISISQFEELFHSLDNAYQVGERPV